MSINLIRYFTDEIMNCRKITYYLLLIRVNLQLIPVNKWQMQAELINTNNESVIL